MKRKSNFFTCAKKRHLLACDELFSASLRKDRRASRSATTRTPGTGIPSGRRQLLIYFWHQALRSRHPAWLPGRLRRGRDHAGLQLARLPVRDEVDHESPAASQHHARHQYDGWIVWRVREKNGRRSSRATGCRAVLAHGLSCASTCACDKLTLPFASLHTSMRMPQTHPFLPCARSPWIVNYGHNAAVSGVALGAASLRNAIVSVTSWGYTDTNIKVQGAS